MQRGRHGRLDRATNREDELRQCALRELLGELAEQTRSLVQIELSLVRAELRERGALI